jgi:hypothetical protein
VTRARLGSCSPARSPPTRRVSIRSLRWRGSRLPLARPATPRCAWRRASGARAACDALGSVRAGTLRPRGAGVAERPRRGGGGGALSEGVAARRREAGPVRAPCWHDRAARADPAAAGRRGARGARGAGRGARGAGRGARGVALTCAGVGAIERLARAAGGASGPGGVARSLVPRPPALLCALPPANRSWTRCRACRRLYDRPPPRPVRRGPRTRGLRAVLAIPDAFSG